MSYQLGFAALIRKFRERFPEPEFQWEHKYNESRKSGGYVRIGDEKVFLGLHLAGPYQRHAYRIHKNNQLVCEISGDLTFGIRLTIQSPYMKTFSLHKRPLNLTFSTQECRRHWLRNKPQFKKLGANFASHILREMEKEHGK